MSIRLFVDEGLVKKELKNQVDPELDGDGVVGTVLPASCVRGLRRFDS